jgi:hypothetical protein
MLNYSSSLLIAVPFLILTFVIILVLLANDYKFMSNMMAVLKIFRNSSQNSPHRSFEMWHILAR